MEETYASKRQVLGSESGNRMLSSVKTKSIVGLGEGSIIQIKRQFNAETFASFVGLATLLRE